MIACTNVGRENSKNNRKDDALHKILIKGWLIGRTGYIRCSNQSNLYVHVLVCVCRTTTQLHLPSKRTLSVYTSYSYFPVSCLVMPRFSFTLYVAHMLRSLHLKSWSTASDFIRVKANLALPSRISNVEIKQLLQPFHQTGITSHSSYRDSMCIQFTQVQSTPHLLPPCPHPASSVPIYPTPFPLSSPSQPHQWHSS